MSRNYLLARLARRRERVASRRNGGNLRLDAAHRSVEDQIRDDITDEWVYVPIAKGENPEQDVSDE